MKDKSLKFRFKAWLSPFFWRATKLPPAVDTPESANAQSALLATVGNGILIFCGLLIAGTLALAGSSNLEMLRPWGKMSAGASLILGIVSGCCAIFSMMSGHNLSRRAYLVSIKDRYTKPDSVQSARVWSVRWSEAGHLLAMLAALCIVGSGIDLLTKSKGEDKQKSSAISADEPNSKTAPITHIGQLLIKRLSLEEHIDAPASDAQPIHSQKAAAEAAKQEERALKAAEESAQWTQIAALISLGATIISFGGFVLLFRSLRQTQEAINTDRSVGHAQASAYLHIERAELFWGNDGGTAPHITLQIQNTGQTPARWFECAYRVIPYTDQHNIRELVLTYAMEPNRTWDRYASLGGGGELAISIDDADTKETIIPIFNAKDEGIVVCGFLKYENVFGEIFRSDYAFHSGFEHDFTLTPKKIAPAGVSMLDKVAIESDRTEVPTLLSRSPCLLATYQRQDR